MNHTAPQSAYPLQPTLPHGPMDPRDRLRRYGPVRPMECRPSLLERILFA